ncbi:PREDICTED: uncharacterized protein LOC106549373 [Thamnophis sirtalis]|uniref:Uncharacterized protein LOC106549373 n=1 Tax=Thamnophis sirtalis TaxID=35019 RepID=A0A6I9YE79_9SAUR|nr:PREDICTED: uncharacterized protein LOC106549373 [Thamnophis sirtalis]
MAIQGLSVCTGLREPSEAQRERRWMSGGGEIWCECHLNKEFSTATILNTNSPLMADSTASGQPDMEGSSQGGLLTVPGGPDLLALPVSSQSGSANKLHDKGSKDSKSSSKGSKSKKASKSADKEANPQTKAGPHSYSPTTISGHSPPSQLDSGPGPFSPMLSINISGSGGNLCCHPVWNLTYLTGDYTKVRGSGHGSLHLSSQCPSTMVPQKVPRNRGRRDRCPPLALDSGTAIRLPSTSTITQDHTQGHCIQGGDHTNCPALATSAMVCGSSDIVRGEALEDPARPSIPQPGFAGAPGPPVAPDNCLALEREGLRLDRFSARVIDTIQAFRRHSTDRIYNPTWRVFCEWCSNRIMPVSALVPQVLEFPQDGLEKGLSPNTLRRQKSPKSEWLDLCGAQIEWTKEKSSKKNVFQVTTVSGNEVLLQSDIDFIIFDWFRAIKNTIDRLPKEKSYISKNNELKIQRSSSSELLSIHANSKEPKTENRKSLIFRLNYSKSDTNDTSQVKSRLKKFITRRPSLKTLQEKGIIKDQIFGAYLHNVCEHDGSTVPRFVKMCIKAVEERGVYFVIYIHS